MLVLVGVSANVALPATATAAVGMGYEGASPSRVDRRC